MAHAAARRGPGPAVITLVRHSILPEEHAKCFVVPGRAHIGSGAERASFVTWTNHTGGTVWVWFPNGAKLFDKPESYFANPIKIKDKGESDPLNVKDGVPSGFYRYHIYCEIVQDYADGNSEPEVDVP